MKGMKGNGTSHSSPQHYQGQRKDSPRRGGGAERKKKEGEDTVT